LRNVWCGSRNFEQSTEKEEKKEAGSRRDRFRAREQVNQAEVRAAVRCASWQIEMPNVANPLSWIGSRSLRLPAYCVRMVVMSVGDSPQRARSGRGEWSQVGFSTSNPSIPPHARHVNPNDAVEQPRNEKSSEREKKANDGCRGRDVLLSPSAPFSSSGADAKPRVFHLKLDVCRDSAVGRA